MKRRRIEQEAVTCVDLRACGLPTPWAPKVRAQAGATTAGCMVGRRVRASEGPPAGLFMPRRAL